MIMNMSIEKMLSHVYEIEGLMLVSRRLGEENTPEVITNKMHRKVRELAEMCGMEIAAGQETPEQQPQAQPVEKPVAAEAPAQEEPAVADSEGLPEDDYDADETWQHDNGEEFKEVFKLDYEEPQHVPVEPDKVPVEDREPDDDITVEFIEAPDEEPVVPEPVAPAPAAVTPPPAPVAPEPVAVTPPPAPAVPEAPATVQPPLFHPPVDTSDEPVPEPDPDLLPESVPEPDIAVEFIEAENDIFPEPEEEMPQPPVPTEFPEQSEPVEPLRVDQKLQRHLSKDIRKAFSLNDRFRFQRELFAGSANAMDTALEHIEVMTSYGNAELYFFSQLHWDRDNQDVKDFMEIVRNHFQ